MICVAQCVHGLGLGGAQQVIRHVIASANPAEFRFCVYAAEDGMFREVYEALGAQVNVIPRRWPRLDPGWIRQLHRSLIEDGVDLVHTHLFGDSLHGYFAARRAQLPLMMTLHCDFALQSWPQRVGYRWVLSRPAHFVACSEHVRRTFESGCRPRSGIETIRNGVRIDAASEVDRDTRAQRLLQLGADPEAIVLASIGRLERQKGLGPLLSAYAEVRRSVDTRSCLLLLGEGSLRGTLEVQARRLGIENDVVFAGTRRDVPELLPVIDVVIFNSVWEGLSVALLEAMETARCVVATDVPGNTEALRPDREALIVRPGDHDALVDALRVSVLNGKLRERLGKAARARLCEHFSADTMVEGYERLYRRLVDPARPRATL
jgi:glycosyltransferase involved in cell wall biosynthesis